MPSSARIVTFLFTDIEGSTRLWEQKPERMRLALARHDAIARAAVESHHGMVVKMSGDGIHAAFDDPLDALNASLELQHALADPERTNGIALRVRCGLHAGVDERRDNDFFGRSVNRAARIMSAAHGGQVLLSQAIVELVRDRLPPEVSLRDLGTVWLRDMTSQEHVYQLDHPQLRHDFPPLRAAERTRTNLPPQHTSFIGREEELRQVNELLLKQRVVSVVGSGGIGKTRLALQAGGELQTHFPDGTWFVDLAPLAAPDQVAEIVASLFPATERGSRSATEAAVACLRQRHLLLILDNCEHVVSEVTHLVTAILKSCPAVTILVTSREPLSVQGEYTLRMQPLPFPERPERITAEQAMQYGAVRLFIERAEAALGGFAMTDPMAPVVAEICKRLDGIALAIELAVPRLKMLKPDELLARLKERFQLLTGGHRTALPRQQTLLAATDWSYRLLSEHEQLLLRRLAIFPDTFTIESAEAVCGDPPIETREVFDLVAALVDKSLVVPVVSTRGASRYKLLESTHEFGIERLRESGDSNRQRRLAEYLVLTYEDAERLWDTTPDAQWYDAYEPDLGNVRAMLAWAFGPDGDALLGIALIAHTSHLVLWWSRAQRQRWFEMAGARLDDSVPLTLVGRVKLAVADCTGAHRGQREGSSQALEAAEIFRRLGDAKNRAWALMIAGDSLIDAADTKEAESYYEEAEALLRPLGATKQLASVLAAKGVRRGLWAGDTAGARTLFAESLSLARAVGYRHLIEATTIHQGELEAIDGLFDAAIARAREAEAVFRQSGNEYFLNVALANLSGYLLAVGDVSPARAVGAEALHLARYHGDSYWINGVLERLALAAALSGDAMRAARLAGYCEAAYQLDSAPRERVEHRTWQTLVERLDAVLAPAEKSRLMTDGAAWDEDQAVAAALEQ